MKSVDRSSARREIAACCMAFPAARIAQGATRVGRCLSSDALTSRRHDTRRTDEATCRDRHSSADRRHAPGGQWRKRRRPRCANSFVWFEDTSARAIDGRRGIAGLPESLLPLAAGLRVVERRFAEGHMHLLCAVRLTCRGDAAERIASLYTAALAVGTVAWVGTGAQYERAWTEMYGPRTAASSGGALAERTDALRAGTRRHARRASFQYLSWCAARRSTLSRPRAAPRTSLPAARHFR